MWVKICANTSLADTQMAVDLGANAVGFVFAPSARRVTPEETGAITSRLVGEVERVGVFPAWEFEAVRDAVALAGLRGVQMHGDYRPEMLRRLRDEFGDAVTIAQTLHWSVESDGRSMGRALLEQMREMSGEGLVDRVLVDAKVGGALGGTGRTFDWEAAKGLFEQTEKTRMILAGGLHPENVAEAVSQLAPWGVDVASGVESAPGRKNPERLRLFLERARAARTDVRL